MFDPKELLTSLADRFSASGNVRNVFGEPIEAHGRTIIPVACVRYGLGAGGGGGYKTSSEDAPGGSGGGGGVKVTPAGMLEISDAEVRFIRFFDVRLAACAFACGFLAAKLLRRRKSARDRRMR